MLNKNEKEELLKVFTDLIKLDTQNPPGNEKPVTDYIQKLLKENGIESSIYSKKDGRTNLYASIGKGEGVPIILLSHIDVVPAPGTWKHPPFEAVNDNGTIYGRGTLDTKHLTAMQLMSMIWLARKNEELNRPVILLATADEEGGSGYGMEFLSSEHPELIPKGYVISEGGGFTITQGNQRFRTCTCGEKGNCKMTLTVKESEAECAFDPYGTMAGKLLKSIKNICQYDAKERLTPPTKKFYNAVNGIIEDPTLKNLWQYSTRNCLAIDGYDIDFNSINQDEIKMGLTYQYIHGTEKEEITEMMEKLLEGCDAQYEIQSFSDGYECDVNNPFIAKLEEVSMRYDSETRLLPMIALGRTDGRFIKNNVYGYSPMLDDVPFSQVLKKIHQEDECITEESLFYGTSVLYETIKEIASSDINF